MVNSFIIHFNDDVVTVTKAILKGETIKYVLIGREVEIEATENIPLYHKAAVKNVNKGSNLHKYGEVIGYATRDIKIGEHVHTQNLSDLTVKEGSAT